jgi:2-oxoglutarate/2-oxoacid ferredoxin oxidoreductase subunit beta
MKKEEFCTYETAWCPGCGDFNILESLRDTLNQLGKKPHEVVIVAGIGQAAKTPQYINANAFCGLHGRALPPAVAIKIANKDLTVIINTGEGDSYGEGGNHFIHNIRRNVDVTHFVHDNRIYGLTKGQASPTTDVGYVTDVQVMGTINEPFNPVLVALAAGAGFVATAFSGEKEHLVEMMKEAINYRGYSLVNILQPCVSFNKVNTFAYYKKKISKLGDDYDFSKKENAVRLAMEWGEKIPIGIIYKKQKEDYHSKIEFLNNAPPLIDQKHDMTLVKKMAEEFI